MKDTLFTVKTNRKIAKITYEMTLVGDTEGIRCGQFVNIKIEGFFLRRPISVCNIEGNTLTLIYKTVGEGTAVMAEMVHIGHGIFITKSHLAQSFVHLRIGGKTHMALPAIIQNHARAIIGHHIEPAAVARQILPRFRGEDPRVIGVQ